MDTSTNMSNSARSKAKASGLPDIIGLGGAVAGLGAGLVMAALAAVIAGARGVDIWLEAKQIAAPLFPGFDPSVSGFVAGPIIVGTLIHLLLSMVFGATFSIVKRRILKLPSDMGVPVLAGLIYGFALWLLAFFIVLPLINPALLDMYQPAFIGQHLVYGVLLGLFYAMLRPLPYSENAQKRLFIRSAERE
ncbi:MAG: hypothetical protein H7Z42_20585 [Roseiflexaceae bacterium]|nr:hypothetical protein [Roseiflexaceae bacterium]